ncbi:hypothetical protein Y1Q_0024527 [Alligator mississippiensis]|uniref:HTH psq-type domain-containing protein n=1 Tax=Alligator mississippiensis TaxID=8496 RepID=A0A151NAR4_ALLMI|nr:hypothetical protein Y1Q_0024527 [Alligator mississippiensis]
MASKCPTSLSPTPLPGPPMKRKRTSLTLETKLEILNCAEAGEGPSALGCAFNLGESTIHAIKKNADNIRSSVMHSTPLAAKTAMRSVISIFKTCYLRRSISQLLEDTDGPNKPTIREWWKAYNVRDTINIKASWDEAKSTTINSAWKPLSKECVIVSQGSLKLCTTVRKVIDLGQKVGGDGFSDLEEADVMELIDSHNEELSTDELIETVAADKEEEKQD